jgi:uncharacterized protein YegP (UPF0339 family)
MASNRRIVLLASCLRSSFGALVLIALLAGALRAQAPLKEEQMVYRLRLFSGSGYQHSFCPQSEDTIYVIADSDNVFQPMMTLVYYWPITRRYEAAFKTLNEPVDGVVELLHGEKVIARLQPRTYTVALAKGWYAGTSEIILDENATRRYEQYQQALTNYTAQLKIYRTQKEAYRSQMEDFFAKTRRTLKPGSKSKFEPAIPVPQEPAFPAAPEFFVQQPRHAFIIHLTAGKYRIRLRASDGSIIEGSEKWVVSFTHRRSGQVGYEVISAKRWTMPETSGDPGDVFYLEGRQTLYFRPYLQNEYNHLYYSKLLDPQNDGFADMWRWVNIKQIEKGRLQLIKDGRPVASIEEKPYHVQQIPGAELGYTIIEYEPAAFGNRGPSLVGYKTEFEPGKGGYQIRLVDEAGMVVDGSIRELRAVEVANTWRLHLAAVILPLIVWAPVFIWRRWKLA